MATRDQRIAGWLKGSAVVLGCLLALGACVATSFGGDNSTTVPTPTATERTDTVAVLERASASQGICYGWQLHDSNGRVVNVGSNLGDGVPVEFDPVRCARFIEVIADVTYTSSSSELNDSARVRVTSSADLTASGFVAGLERLGVDNDAFIDEPGWSICRAAVFLPLLAAEADLVPPMPAGTADPAGNAAPPATGSTPAALPDAGSDIWRDRWPYLLGAAALLLVTVLMVAIGWFERRHQRRAPTGPPGGLRQ